MNNAAHTLSVHGLGCVRQQRVLFSNLSFELRAHQLLFIEGENGAGKSSLMRLLAGHATPATGDIHWNGSSLRDQLTSDDNPLHFISHDNGLKLNLTVHENLRLACHLQEADINNIEFAIAQLNLLAQKNTLARQLSSGQQRRLALARLCLIKKPLWLLDEPLTALDHNTQKIFIQLLQQHLNSGGMCIITSHQALPSEFANMQTVRLQSC